VLNGGHGDDDHGGDDAFDDAGDFAEGGEYDQEADIH
jgi:hypothetical protein